MKKSSQIALVYSATSLEDMDEIIDTDASGNSVRWQIQGLSRLRPGATDLLWFVGVKR